MNIISSPKKKNVLGNIEKKNCALIQFVFQQLFNLNAFYTMSDCLEEIRRNDWAKLRDLYALDGSRSYLAYTAIDNYIRWLEQNPALKHIKFYCLNGDFSDGTFAIIVSFEFDFIICLYIQFFN